MDGLELERLRKHPDPKGRLYRVQPVWECFYGDAYAHMLESYEGVKIARRNDAFEKKQAKESELAKAGMLGVGGVDARGEDEEMEDV